MNKEVILAAKEIYKNFKIGKSKNTVLNNVTLDIFANDFTVIMGPSGAGKSTLLYVLSGMDKINQGQILYKNQDISKMKESGLEQLRANDFSFVFQDSELISNLTIEENVRVAGIVKKEITAQQLNQATTSLLKQMRIMQIKDHLPNEVSGGQAQRAAMARALVKNPHILFADEPTGSLNRKNTEELLSLLTDANNQGQSILMVTHDINSAIRGNRIIYLVDGQVLDELNLAKFKETDIDDRREKVLSWLNKLSW